jgi:hypothetical protein
MRPHAADEAYRPERAVRPASVAPRTPQTAVAPSTGPVAAFQRAFGNGAVQRLLAAASDGPEAPVRAAAAMGTRGAGGRLPHLDVLQRAFGRHDLRQVRAHTDGGAAAATRMLGAEAFATGDHVAFAGPPSLRTAAHEAAHVVQQRAGVHLKGGVGAVGDRYERHADAVADRVVRGGSAEALLDAPPAAGPAAGPAAQFVLAFGKVLPILSNLLEEHAAQDKYQQLWKSGDAKRIAEEVGGLEDTTKDNAKRRLAEHKDIRPLLLGHRMRLEGTGPAPSEMKVDQDEVDPAQLSEVYRAFRHLLFFHASKAHADIRASGLDPDHGGKDGGLSDERSLVARREQNLAAAKHKVFVTRKYSEAKGYADGHEERIVMLIVPREFQNDLQVDPDSQFGVMGADHLKGTILENKYPNWWGSSYLIKEINGEAAKLNFVSLWTVLIQKGLIKP